LRKRGLRLGEFEPAFDQFDIAADPIHSTRQAAVLLLD